MSRDQLTIRTNRRSTPSDFSTQLARMDGRYVIIWQHLKSGRKTLDNRQIALLAR